VTPTVSVVMPTLNAERTLERALTAVRAQSLPAEAIEVLVVDGGSQDATREIAQRFGCRVLENPRVLPEFAKSVGLAAARGRFGVFLDADEEIIDPASFETKVRLLDQVTTVHSVVTAGLATPQGYTVVSDYANRFGDPFSYFMYRLDGGDYVPGLRARAKTIYEDESAVVFRFPPEVALPICDGGGHFFRLERLRTVANVEDAGIVSRVFNLLAAQERQLAVVKRDFVRHYSTSTVRGLVRKIDWRVVGNVHHAASGVSGHSTRESAQPRAFNRRKFLFVPYALSVIAPLADAAWLSWRYRDAGYMIHAPLAVFTALDIIWHLGLRVAGVRPKWRAYG
jgi:glycosyltransferase involved in cell wall biosynthesis